MSGNSDLLLEKKGASLWATINREERRNALSEDVFNGLIESLRRSDEDRSIRSIVWTGAGDKAFCAGGDLKPQKGVFSFDHAEPTTLPVNLTRAALGARVPIIGRINGHCLAGGMGVLAMCDIAVGVENAKFGLPEVKRGIFPMQIYPVLQEIVPRRILTEMCVTGEPISAARAAEVGLLNYVVKAADLDAKVEELVRSVEDASPTGIRRGKFAMRSMAAMTLEQALSFSESQVMVTVQTEDAREGRLAFNEKRKPVWTGR
jgi:enoyl-CoA hydratase/carnithine racemase